jgi:microcystin-dependent protein
MSVDYYINASNDTMPIGLLIVASNFVCDDSILLCNGRELLCEDYPKLFNIIGDTYGGNLNCDAPTFNLPELRGRFDDEARIIESFELINPEDSGEDVCYFDRIGL